MSGSGCNNILDKSEGKNSQTHKWNYVFFINAPVKIGNMFWFASVFLICNDNGKTLFLSLKICEKTLFLRIQALLLIFIIYFFKNLFFFHLILPTSLLTLHMGTMCVADGTEYPLKPGESLLHGMQSPNTDPLCQVRCCVVLQPLPQEGRRLQWIHLN